MSDDRDKIYAEAEDALALLENASFQACLKALDDETVDIWRKAVSADMREDMYHRQAALRGINDWLLGKIDAAATYDGRMKNPSAWRAQWDKLRNKEHVS
jgi:hypothetical protein